MPQSTGNPRTSGGLQKPARRGRDSWPFQRSRTGKSPQRHLAQKFPFALASCRSIDLLSVNRGLRNFYFASTTGCSFCRKKDENFLLILHFFAYLTPNYDTRRHLWQKRQPKRQLKSQPRKR